jgi:hypothetical protein
MKAARFVGIAFGTASLALVSAGCAGRYTILTVPAISMTNAAFDPSYRAAPGPRVEAKFCSGDDPIVSKDDHVGLIDEAVMKAQQQTGATYLSDVVIAREDECVVVTGTAMR